MPGSTSVIANVCMGLLQMLGDHGKRCMLYRSALVMIAVPLLC